MASPVCSSRRSRAATYPSSWGSCSWSEQLAWRSVSPSTSPSSSWIPESGLRWRHDCAAGGAWDRWVGRHRPAGPAQPHVSFRCDPARPVRRRHLHPPRAAGHDLGQGTVDLPAAHRPRSQHQPSVRSERRPLPRPRPVGARRVQHGHLRATTLIHRRHCHRRGRRCHRTGGRCHRCVLPREVGLVHQPSIRCLSTATAAPHLSHRLETRSDGSAGAGTAVRALLRPGTRRHRGARPGHGRDGEALRRGGTSCGW